MGQISELDANIRSDLDVRVADIRDSEAVMACCEDVDVIFHLAALIGIPYSYLAPRSYIQVNVTGTMNFLNAARRLGIAQFVQTSTSEVYGSAQYVPIDEKHPLVAQSPYSASKIAADKLAESYALSFSLPVAIIRPFNTFGPRQSLRAIIPTLASQLLDRDVSEVHAGSLHPVRDYTYVADTAAAFIKTIGCAIEPGQTINLGTGVGFSIAEIYARLQDICEVEKPIVQDAERVRPDNSEVARLISDNALARKLLNWEPKVSFDAGLKKVVAHLRTRGLSQTSVYYR